MILGRTTEGLIKIKKDDPLGLRAVNCACCGDCFQITEAQYEYLKSNPAMSFFTENEGGSPFAPKNPDPACGGSFEIIQINEYLENVTSRLFVDPGCGYPSPLSYVEITYSAQKETYPDPGKAPNYTAFFIFIWGDYDESSDTFQTYIAGVVCGSNVLKNLPFTAFGDMGGSDQITILFNPPFVPPTP